MPQALHRAFQIFAKGCVVLGIRVFSTSTCPFLLMRLLS
jgi:hypothetical protein